MLLKAASGNYSERKLSEVEFTLKMAEFCKCSMKTPRCFYKLKLFRLYFRPKKVGVAIICIFHLEMFRKLSKVGFQNQIIINSSENTFSAVWKRQESSHRENINFDISDCSAIFLGVTLEIII